MARRRAADPAPTPPALSRGRRRLFVGVTLALPWLLLALLEGGLRAAGAGDAYPLFVPYAERPEFHMPNEQVGRRWFRGAFVPSTHLDFFRARKADGAVRVVFQGESSAAGFPYGHGGAPSRMLEERLQATFPGREVEVINTALTAVSSYVLLDQADEIVALRPDAVLVYTGHNEYYGVFGVGAAGRLGRSPALVRAYLALRRLRTVQLLERAIARDDPATRGGGTDAPGTVMELMAGDQRIPLGSPRYAAGVAQLRANLDALLARYQAAGIPVYVGTLVSNERDQPPLVTALAPGVDSAAWWARHAAAVASLARGDTAGARSTTEALVRADSNAAGAWWTLGRIHDARRDVAGARAAYRAAKERDVLRFRAPEAMNAVIREVAARRGAVVVESQRAVERASPDGIPGRALILEHLHPNVDGYFVIADAFYETLRSTRAFGAWPAPLPPSVGRDSARARVPVTAVDSIAALLRTDRLTAGWPFVPRGTGRLQLVDTLRPRTPAESLGQALVRGTVSWAEATDRLRAAYERDGDADRAIHAALALAQEYRYSAQPYLDASRVALAAGREAEALRHARAAHARRETPETARLLGLLLLRRGEPAAIPVLERAARLAPDDPAMKGPLAAARMLPFLTASRASAPRDTAVLYKLAVAYVLTQQLDSAHAALDALDAVAAGHPGAAALRQQLGAPTHRTSR